MLACVLTVRLLGRRLCLAPASVVPALPSGPLSELAIPFPVSSTPLLHVSLGLAGGNVPRKINNPKSKVSMRVGALVRLLLFFLVQYLLRDPYH